jgi:hypothetical protein
MKKSILIVLCVVMATVLLVGCGNKSGAANSPTLLTVSGKIDGGAYNVTEDTFANNSKEVQYHDPWVGDSGSDVKEKGILLKDLIKLTKAASDAKTIALICTDGKEYDVTVADAQAYDIMLVHWVDGKVLENKTGGPVKVAYPKEATAYPNESWAWWIVKVEFK